MGRSISDRLSYRKHYMCSGEATSFMYGFSSHYGLIKEQFIERGLPDIGQFKGSLLG